MNSGHPPTVGAPEQNSSSDTPDSLTHADRARRVLIYGMNYAPEQTGVGRYTGEIGEFLASQGIAVEVVTAPPHYPGWKIRGEFGNRYSVERKSTIRITRCPLFLKKQIRGIARALVPLSFAIASAPVAIWRILRVRPHVVLCIEPTILSAPIGLLAAKLIGARTVLHVQDLELDAAFAVGHLKGSSLNALGQWFERKILKAFDHVITISKAMHGKLMQKDVPVENLSIVRNWVDVTKIRPLSGPNRYRQELAIPEDAFIVQYAGNVGAKQALDVVIDAAEKLKHIGRLIFVIAGDGPEKERLQERSAQLPNIRFLGVQPEERLCEFLNLADAHVLPQDAGAADLVLPSKIGGMLASGKPCIVTANPGTELWEFLHRAAILSPAGDAEALAQAITRLIDDGDTRLSLRLELAGELNADKSLQAFTEVLFPAETVRSAIQV